MAALKFKKQDKLYLPKVCTNGYILKDGATTIQRVWRGFYCRQWYSSLWNAIRGKVCWPEYILEGAAIQIQRAWRSFHSRRDFMLQRVYEETDKLFGRFDGVCRYTNGATAIQSSWRGFNCRREYAFLVDELHWLKGIRQHHKISQQTMQASYYTLPFSSKLHIRRIIDQKKQALEEKLDK